MSSHLEHEEVKLNGYKNSPFVLYELAAVSLLRRRGDFILTKEAPQWNSN